MATAKLKAADVNAILEECGYSFDALTDGERRCISAKIEKLVGEGKSKDQAVAIAYSMCAPSKARAQYAGSFSAAVSTGLETQNKIELRGGNYRWSKLADGSYVIYDVPLFAELAKGEKGAPVAVDKAYLEGVVTKAQERYYGDQPYCARLFVGHHKEIALTDPEFIGFVLPNRVGTYKLENEKNELVTKCTVFGNLKVNQAGFERIKRGELPGLSVELPWEKKRISGAALLSTRPPYFEFANLTLGEEVSSNEPAKFNAIEDPEFQLVGTFQKSEDINVTKEELDALLKETAKKAAEEAVAEFAAKNAPGSKRGGKLEGEGEGEGEGGKKGKKAKMAAKNVPGSKRGGKLEGEGEGDGDGEADGDGDADGDADGDGDGDGKKGGNKGKFEGEPDTKRDPLPTEPDTDLGNGKMSNEEVAAMFAERDAKIAKFEAEIKRREEADKKREEEAKKQERVALFDKELKDFITTPDLKATFAAHFCNDDKQARAYIDSMKKNLQPIPPSDAASFQGMTVEPNAPSVATFAGMGPDAAAEAGKFAAIHREFSKKGLAEHFVFAASEGQAGHKGKPAYEGTEAEWVKFQMELAKAEKATQNPFPGMVQSAKGE